MPRKVFLPLVCLLLTVSGSLRAQTSADLSLTKDDSPDPVIAGSLLIYTLTLSNEGPDAASAVTLDDTLPAGTTFQSLSSPAGWSCSSPAVGSGGAISCSVASFSPGSEVFTLTVLVDAGVASGTVLTNTATVSSTTPDPNPGSETATVQTTVTGATTVISLTKADSPDPVTAGGNLTYTLTTGNNGADALESATVTDVLPAGTTFVSLSSPAGWSCTTPAVGAVGTVSCTIAPFVPGAAVFSLEVRVGTTVADGTNLSNQASLDVTDSGRTTTQVASATTLVLNPAPLATIPTLDEVGLALLATMLAMAGAWRVRRG